MIVVLAHETSETENEPEVEDVEMETVSLNEASTASAASFAWTTICGDVSAARILNSEVRKSRCVAPAPDTEISCVSEARDARETVIVCRPDAELL